MAIESSKSHEMLIAVGDNLFAYGKVDPAVFKSLRRDCLIGNFHEALTKGFDSANKWLALHYDTQILPMVVEDRLFASEPQVGWLLCRLSSESLVRQQVKNHA